MAINENEFYHGAVFSRLFKSKKALKIDIFPIDSKCAYVINEKIGIYIKHSTKKISPWRFSFYQHQQDDLYEMKKLCKKVYLILVCWHDGIASIEFDDLKNVLDDTHEPIEWISASRMKREKYTIKGSDGKLKFKIGENEFPRKILENLS